MKKNIIISIASIAMFLYTSTAFTEVDLSYAGVDISECYGWKRTAIMDDVEIQLINTLEELCKTQNKDGINALLDMPENALEISCKPQKDIYVEPEEPIIEITFKNITTSPVRFVEMEVQPTSVVSYLPDKNKDYCPSDIKQDDYYNTWKNDMYISPTSYPRYLKQLEPHEIFTINQPLKIEGYGRHKINYRMGIRKINLLTHNRKSSSGKHISEGSCYFQWIKQDNQSLKHGTAQCAAREFKR